MSLPKNSPGSFSHTFVGYIYVYYELEFCLRVVTMAALYNT